MKIKLVLHTVGRVLILEAALMLLPLAVSVIYGDKCLLAVILLTWSLSAMGFCSGAASLTGLAVWAFLCS